mmetsp:Transcript_13263/g.23494  ORF Transcript_13263/g.23494 Transcript_13263/m.23494 type:complete len:328 (-) Transcript_13263:572-1555(-)
MEEDFDREIKVIVVGNGGVGKTSMIRRFSKGIFTNEYKKTIGVDFLEKAHFVDSLQEEVRFMLWDTAGQEEFNALTRTYYRGAGAAVLAFSTTDSASFEAISDWKSKVESECGDIAMCIVQNKIDLLDQAVVSNETVEAMARKLGLKLYRTCVKENLNVTEAFVYLAELQNRKVMSGQMQAGPATAYISQPVAPSITTAAAAVSIPSLPTPPQVTPQESAPPVPLQSSPRSVAPQQQSQVQQPPPEFQQDSHQSQQQQLQQEPSHNVPSSYTPPSSALDQPPMSHPYRNESPPDYPMPQVIDLQPSKKRTKGKKALKDRLTGACSIL